MSRKPKEPSQQLPGLERTICDCRLCPRLVNWREAVARKPRARYADQKYWAKPVPGWGDPNARLLVVGLAPAAHGGNRTGRMFTGDRSGDWLYRALHHAGFANQPTSVSRDDGLALHDAFVSAIVRCAPPANKPTPTERDTCLPYLTRELELLANLKVIVALGRFAWDGIFRAINSRPAIAFAHGATTRVGRFKVIGSYHPSQQNTFTGRLTENMFNAIFAQAKRALRQDRLKTPASTSARHIVSPKAGPDTAIRPLITHTGCALF